MKNQIQALDLAQLGLSLALGYQITVRMTISALAQRPCLLRWMLSRAKWLDVSSVVIVAWST